jgi:hypothetical protein
MRREFLALDGVPAEAGFPDRWDEEARRELGLNRGDGYR